MGIGGITLNLEEIKAFLESNKDKEDVKTYLNELTALSADKVKDYLDSEDGKRIIQPALDKYHAKSLASWKTNNLNGLVEEELKKRNPDKSPAEIEIAQLRKEIEDERKASKREKLMNTAIKQANEKGLPVDILDYFVSDDEETTTANLAKLEEAYNKSVQSSVEAKFKENGRTVPNGQGNAQTGSIKSITEMAAAHNLRNQNN